MECVDGKDEVCQVFGIIWEEKDIIEGLDKKAVLKDTFDESDILFGLIGLFLNLIFEGSDSLFLICNVGHLLKKLEEHILVLFLISFFICVFSYVETVDQVVANQSSCWNSSACW